MFAWLAQNYVTILLCAGLIALVAAIIASLIRDKRQGRSSCGSNCAHCSMAGSCHKK